jgi:hypothetical protein
MKKDFWQWSRPFWAAFFVQPFPFVPARKIAKDDEKCIAGRGHE